MKRIILRVINIYQNNLTTAPALVFDARKHPKALKIRIFFNELTIFANKL